MPGKIYMGNDYRPDHSIRIPRPDLSEKLGTPNACNRCHIDKSNEWSADYTSKWYGIKRKNHFGTSFAAGRNNEPDAIPGLLQLVADPLAPLLVRATALSLLGRYPSQEVSKAFQLALISDESLLRRTGAAYFPAYSAEQRKKMLSPLLKDPVKAVRIEAARALTTVPLDQLDPKQLSTLDQVLAEFQEMSLYSADFAASRLNLGALYSYQGKLPEAEKHLKEATNIDRDFYTARTNLAVLYSRQGKNDLAEQQLRTALERNPDLADVHYSLGLLLSEKKQYEEAVKHLQFAATGMVNNGRVYYNLGQLLIFLRREQEAETALKKSVEIDSANMNYLQALARFYIKSRQVSQARAIAEQMLFTNPENPLGQQLLDYLNSRLCSC